MAILAPLPYRDNIFVRKFSFLRKDHFRPLNNAHIFHEKNYFLRSIISVLYIREFFFSTRKQDSGLFSQNSPVGEIFSNVKADDYLIKLC